MPNVEEFSSNRQLARRLGVTPPHVANLLATGELTPVRTGLSSRSFATKTLDSIRARQEERLAAKSAALGTERGIVSEELLAEARRSNAAMLGTWQKLGTDMRQLSVDMQTLVNLVKQYVAANEKAP